MDRLWVCFNILSVMCGVVLCCVMCYTIGLVLFCCMQETTLISIRLSIMLQTLALCSVVKKMLWCQTGEWKYLTCHPNYRLNKYRIANSNTTCERVWLIGLWSEICIMRQGFCYMRIRLWFLCLEWKLPSITGKYIFVGSINFKRYTYLDDMLQFI